jgi:8-oxo-dGTP pyrophosphatase MutT (NUDIX family)
MPTFAVATKGVIFNNNNEVLIIFKSEIEDINPNTADIPGGRLEFKETLEEGLAREIREEVGLEVEIIAPSRAWSMVKEDKDLQLVGITYLCYTKENTEILLSEEHTSAKWVPVNKIFNGEYPKWIQEELKAAQKIATL